MDVASFVALGNVFTSAMTGNTALLGIAVSHGDPRFAAIRKRILDHTAKERAELGPLKL